MNLIEVGVIEQKDGRKVRIYADIGPEVPYPAPEETTPIPELLETSISSMVKIYTGKNIPAEKINELLEMPQPKFGKMVREIRKAKKIKQKNFFERSKIKQSNLSNIERGEINPKLEKRQRIIAGLNLNTANTKKRS